MRDSVFVLEALVDGEVQMWGVFSTKERLREKATEIRRYAGRKYCRFFCNECEVDTGAISSESFEV